MKNSNYCRFTVLLLYRIAFSLDGEHEVGHNTPHASVSDLSNSYQRKAAGGTARYPRLRSLFGWNPCQRVHDMGT